MGEPSPEVVEKVLKVLTEALSFNGAKGIAIIESSLRMIEGQPVLHQLMLRSYEITLKSGVLAENMENTKYQIKRNAREAMASLKKQGAYSRRRESMSESDFEAYGGVHVPKVNRPPESALATLFVAKASLELYGKQSASALSDEALRKLYNGF